MIDAASLRSFIEKKLEGTPYFLVDVMAEPDDRFVVEIDSDEGVDIDFCGDLTRAVDAEFPREEGGDDYELEVGSAGLTSPFKVKRQYLKNVGSDVEVDTADGRRLHGTLLEADDVGFTLGYHVKEKPDGAKRPVLVEKRERFAYPDVRSVRGEIKF